MVEEVVEEFDNSSERTVSDENQPESELLNPAFGDGQVEEDRIVVRWRVEGMGESIAGDGLLLVDEFAADVRVLCESGDGLCASESVECEALSFLGW